MIDDWVERGAQSRYALTPDEVVRRSAPRGVDEATAAARVGEWAGGCTPTATTREADPTLARGPPSLARELDVQAPGVELRGPDRRATRTPTTVPGSRTSRSSARRTTTQRSSHNTQRVGSTPGRAISRSSRAVTTKVRGVAPGSTRHLRAAAPRPCVHSRVDCDAALRPHLGSVLADAAGEHHDVDAAEDGRHRAERAPGCVAIDVEREGHVGVAAGPAAITSRMSPCRRGRQAALGLEASCTSSTGTPRAAAAT